jgi:hypothetical protein
MNTDKNSINSSIDIWVIQIEAMQEDREDKEAVLGITQGKIENISANMLDIVAACSETIDSRIADKQAELMYSHSSRASDIGAREDRSDSRSVCRTNIRVERVDEGARAPKSRFGRQGNCIACKASNNQSIRGKR